MSENHGRRIAHFRRSSVFIAILPVVVGSEAMTEGVMRPTVNDGLADERPVFIVPFRTKILESLAANVFVPTRCGARGLRCKCKPFCQGIGNGHYATLTGFGFRPLDFDCPRFDIDFRPFQRTKLTSPQAGE